MILGRYIPVREIHRTECTEVIQATDCATGLFVAIKRIYPGNSHRSVDSCRKLLETASVLHHPTMVSPVDMGYCDSTGSILQVLPWIDHISPDELRLQPAELIRYTIQISQGLAFLKRNNLGYCSIDQSHILWLPQSEDNNIQLKLISYDFISSHADTQIQQLLTLVETLAKPWFDTDDQVNPGKDRSDILLMLEILRTAVRREQIGSTNPALYLVMDLLKTFDNHPTEMRPTRRIYFTEAPLIQANGFTAGLDDWLEHKGPGSILIVSSLDGLDRDRLLKRWVAGRKLQSHRILDVAGKIADRLVKQFASDANNNAPSALLEGCEFPEGLTLVASSEASDRFRSLKWNSIIDQLKNWGYSMVLSTDSSQIEELIVCAEPGGDYVSYLRFSLPDLSEFESLVNQMLGSTELPRSLLSQLYSTTGGNPGLMVETINFWITEDLLVRERDRWIIRDSDTNRTLPFPPGVKDRILNRLNNLNQDQHHLLKILAFADTPLSLDQLTELSGVMHIDDMVMNLIDRDVLCADLSDSVTTEYWFSFSLLKKAIVNELSGDETKVIHQQIAELMEQHNWDTQSITRHYLLGADRVKAMIRGLEIVNQLRESGDFLKAEEWIDLMQSKMDGLPDTLQGQVYCLHAEISLLRHRHENVLRSAEKGLGLLPVGSDYGEDRSFLYQYMGQVYSREGRYDEAIAVVDRGLAEICNDNSETAVTLRVLRGALHRKSGCYSRAQSDIEAAWQAYECITDPIARHSAYATILNLVGSVCHDKGEIRQYRRISDDSIALSDSKGFTFYQILLRNKRAAVEADCGNVEIAERILSEVYQLCRSANLWSEQVVAYQISSDIAYTKGQYTDAESLLVKAETVREKLRRTENTLVPKQRFIRLYRRTGQFHKAEEILHSISIQRSGKQTTPADLLIDIEDAFLCLDQARYTRALRLLTKSLRTIQQFGGHRSENRVQFGLAMVYWRMNHLARSRRYLQRARLLAERHQNGILQGWILHLEARMKRLDRDRTGFHDCLNQAETLFTQCSSQPGLLAIAELRLREKIDSDLSDATWNEAVRLWERARSVGAWRQILDVATTISRLGVRRGTTRQTSSLLDSILGIVRKKQCLEDLWRLLRVRGLFLERQGFTSSCQESYRGALKVAETVSANIASPILRRSYLERYDIHHMKTRIEQLERETCPAEWSIEKLPVLRFCEEKTTHPVHQYKSEFNRQVKQATERFRRYSDQRELLADLIDVLLKLSRADRCIIYLRDPGQELFRAVKQYKMGMAPEIDPRIVRSSILFQKVINSKQFMFSNDVSIDQHLQDIMLKRHIGTRAVLTVPMRAARNVVGLVYLDARPGSEKHMNQNADYIQDLADEAALSLEIRSLYSDLHDTFMSMVRALGTTVDAKDEYTHGHSARVANYAMIIGKEMGLGAEQMRELEIAAYLHDIGKIGISGGILKSSGSLSEEDQQIMREHPVIGKRILSPVRKLARVSQIIKQHHERYDGTGYPDELKGNEILMSARIISVADALDAMTTIRPYHASMDMAAAIAIISDNSGSQFDPIVAGTVKDLFEKGKFTPA